MERILMSLGYGKQIYRDKKFPLISVIFLALLGILIFFMIFPRGNKSGSIDFPGSEKSAGRQAEPARDTKPASVPDQRALAQASEEPDTGIGLEKTEIGEEFSNPGSGLSTGAGNDGLYRLQARKLFKNHQYRLALAQLLNVSLPGYPDFRDQGVCYYVLEEYDSALVQLQKAVAIRNDDPVTLKFMAFTLYKLDNLEDSLSWTEKALEIENQPELVAFCGRLKREISAMKDYTDRRTDRFKVIFSRFEHDDIRLTVSGILKDAYREIGRQMDYYPRQVLTVILYDEKAFFDITRGPAWVGGLYDGKIRIPIKGVEGQEALLKRVLFHEYTHALIRDITSSCPLWVHEGLAEYFSQENPARIGQVFPLDQLEKRFPSGNPLNVILAYRESFSAVSELISRFGLYRIRELLEALGRGESIGTAFESVFFITYEAFMNSWGRQ
jgi:tetratricopeptide (TPR) repeat protein